MIDKIFFFVYFVLFFLLFGGNLEVKVVSIEKKLEILDDLLSNGEIF